MIECSFVFSCFFFFLPIHTDTCRCSADSCEVAAADVMVVMDQSQGMALEQWWLPIFLRLLNRDLISKGIGTTAACPNRFSMWSFGRDEGTGCALANWNETYGTIEQIAGHLTPSAVLPTDAGDCEDGYQGMLSALLADRRSMTNACVRPMMLLITDEDRDNCGCGRFVDKKIILRKHLKPLPIEYAAILDITLHADNEQNSIALGASRRSMFLPNEQSHENFTAAPFGRLGKAFAGTEKDYYRMALKKEVNGSVWDIKQLRSVRMWQLTNALRKQMVRRLPGKGGCYPLFQTHCKGH